MEIINNLQAIPNQSFSVNIGDYTYSFHIYFCETFLAYDLTIDDVTVVEGFRIVYGQLLIPYTYQEVDGNFVLDMPIDEDPDYESFNDTQFLQYLTQDETDEYREALKNGEY